MQQPQSNTSEQSGAADDDEEDDYWNDASFEGTPLEEYSTPLDFDNGEDEFHLFTSTLLRMCPYAPSLCWVSCVHSSSHVHLLLMCQDSRTPMQPGTTL